MFVTSWIGSAFGKRRNVLQTKDPDAIACAVFVGDAGGNVSVTAEFWKDKRFRLLDSHGNTILAGIIERREFIPAEPGQLFQDLIRDLPDQIGPIASRRDPSQY